MPSNRWKLPIGVSILLLLGYTTIVTSNILLGVVLATLCFFVGWLLGHASESDRIPSLGQRRTVAVAVASAAVLSYAVFVAGTLVGGVAFVLLIIALAFVHAAIAQSRYSPSLGRNRALLVSVLSLLVIAYAVLVVGNVLLGVVAAGLLWLTAWLTSLGAPLRT